MADVLRQPDRRRGGDAPAPAGLPRPIHPDAPHRRAPHPRHPDAEPHSHSHSRPQPHPHPRRPYLHHPAAPPLAALAAAVAASFYLYGTDPHQSGHWLPRCPFNWLTGLLCPACGGTRMAYDLLHGDVTRAFHENALLLLASPALLWMCARWLVEGLRGRRWRPVLGARAQTAVLGVAVVWAVVRNLH